MLWTVGRVLELDVDEKTGEVEDSRRTERAGLVFDGAGEDLVVSGEVRLTGPAREA